MKRSGKGAAEFCDAPPANVWAALCYCDDDGVASDAARALCAAWSSQAESQRLVLTEDEVARDNSLLFDAIEARSLLGGRALIEIRVSSERYASLLLEALAMGEARASKIENRLVVISKGLKKTSKLRKGFEDAACAVAAQFHADETGDTVALVREQLDADGVDITEDALALFAGGLPGHRRLAHSELAKLQLYAHGLGRPVEVGDVRALGVVDPDQQLSGLVEAAFSGKGSDALRELDRLEMAGSNAITILRAIQREAQRMLAAHAAGSGNVGMKLRPPVFARQWPSFQARLQSWPAAHLLRLLERICDCERTARLAGPTASPALRVLVNDMIRLAARKPAART